MAILRSIGAVAAGIVANIAIATGIDYALCSTVMPEMATAHAPAWQLAIALSYRTLIGVGAGWLTARLAPGHAITHATILGFIGLAVATLGVVAMWSVGDHWYPLLLAVLALPASWLGGWIFSRQPAPATA